MSSSSASASATSSAASATSSATGILSNSSNLKVVGILLAVASGVLIGSSFVFKKKGLLRSQAGGVAGEGVGYLKSPLWWIGMTMMILGELCNFAAYAFVEAIVVTPLGALSVVICAILSSIFLKEKLSFFGWLGCGLCIIGSVIIALNGPQEASVGQIREFQKLFLSPGFLGYGSALIAASLVIIFFFAPRYGKKSMLWYIFVCSMIGGISVSVTTGLGSAIVTTAQGDNQFKFWFIYFLIAFVAVTLITEVYYLNVALALFNTAMVTPTYYVIFTFFSIVTTIVLFKGLSASVTSIITLVMGFIVICFGITILQMSKIDPVQLSKLDRRSTLLLQAARQKTEPMDEKDVLGIEDPGMDTLRGSFGAVGSIIRARTVSRLSQSSHASSYRGRSSGLPAPYDPPLSPVNSVSGGNDYLNGLKRHQLYDAPVPPGSPSLAAATRGDDVSSLASASMTGSIIMNKKPTIKFGSQDVIHQYHPTGTGGTRNDKEATHEHRVALGTPGAVIQSGVAGYPPPSRAVPERSNSATTQNTVTSAMDLLSESPTQATAGGSLNQTIFMPPRFRDPSEVQSAPPTLNPRFAKPGMNRRDSRDLFDIGNSPSSATLLSFPSVTDSARSWDKDGVEEVDEQGKGRGRTARRYPKGAGDDDREESVSLWQRNGDDESGEDSELTARPHGGIRLVGSTSGNHK